MRGLRPRLRVALRERIGKTVLDYVLIGGIAALLLGYLLYALLKPEKF